MNGAEVILNILKKYTDKVFIVSGTDYAAFIEARYRGVGPEFIVIPHEITAVSAAMGYSLSGKLGVAMVHTVPGTLNSLGIIADAFSSRIPLIVIAGKSPYTERGSTASRNLRIHWTQDLRDQGGVLRQYVKWDHEIRTVEQIADTIQRGIQIALSEPPGPVYITVPREISVADTTLTEKKMDFTEPGVSTSKLERAKELLSNSSAPLIITWGSGRRRDWFDSVKRFADIHRIPVAGYVGEWLNYPTTGDMALDSYNTKDFDVILVFENEVPWIPKYGEPDAKIIRVDVDPLYSQIPYSGFPCDLCVQSGISDFLDNLNVKKSWDWGDIFVKQREEKMRKLEKMKDSKRIHPALLSYELSKIGWTIYNEYPFRGEYAILNRYNQYYADPGFGHLGWALGAGLGYKISTGENVIITVGDGSFIEGVPTAFLYTAKRHPVLVVIYDNKSWFAVEKAVREVFPSTSMDSFPGADLDIDGLAEVVESISGEYVYIESPSEIQDGLKRGKDAVLAGRTAIIHARTEKV
ncbi:acetolactate synthase [Sulfolobales archaeon HS-7]|nr:acetolactate synthase [Sulfolobales archaeon HS-7]